MRNKQEQMTTCLQQAGVLISSLRLPRNGDPPIQYVKVGDCEYEIEYRGARCSWSPAVGEGKCLYFTDLEVRVTEPYGDRVLYLWNEGVLVMQLNLTWGDDERTLS